MIGVGVIGAGNNGSKHARYYHDCPRTAVVAVADPDEGRATDLAGEVGAEAVADFEQMLDGVDAVVISSPNFLHRDHAVACASAGKHVYCEKPMGLNADEASDIADAVAAAGVRSAVGFSVRFHGGVQTMQHRLEEGAVGDLVSVWSRRLTYYNFEQAPQWRTDYSLSGGLLYEINVHELEWMMALGGQVECVYARKYARDSDNPRANDHIWVILNFANGAVGTHEGSWMASNPEFRRGLTGTEGGFITDRWGNVLHFAEQGGEEVEMETAPPFDLRAHWLDCIDGKAEPICDVAWGLKVMTVAEAVIESGLSGEVVQIQ